jgi:hypothetical protein
MPITIGKEGHLHDGTSGSFHLRQQLLNILLFFKEFYAYPTKLIIMITYKIYKTVPLTFKILCISNCCK